MGIIADINKVATDRERAKDIAYRVQKKRALNQDTRIFAEVLQEELDKAKRGEKA